MMRTLKVVLAVGMVIGGVVGCEKYVSGYDTNPLAPQSANATKTFVGAQLAYVVFTEGWCSMLAAIWADQLHGAQRQFDSYESYRVMAEDFSSDWALAYSGTLKNLRLVQTATDATQGLKGAAEILEGIHMANVAAMWGDVPYSEAAQGEGNTTPHYDTQQSVYTQALATIDRGITDITANAGVMFDDAFSFRGSVRKWVQLAHSAKARYLMHLARARGSVSAYDPATLNSVITEANQGILAVSGADDLLFLHGTAYEGNMDIWHSFGIWSRSGYMDAFGTFVVPMLGNRRGDGKSSDVRRLAHYFDPTGTDLNYSSGGAYDEAASYPGFRASATIIVLAEAYARLGSTSSAIAALNDVRLYNNTAFGDTSAPFVASDFPSPTALLQTILNEEYLTLMHQMEVFSFLRRIDYAITYSDTAGTLHSLQPKQGSKFPYRFVYSVDELTGNPNRPIEAVGVLDQFSRTWANH
jgi:starch-binding outer membrane protein, SusD/RagB family